MVDTEIICKKIISQDGIQDYYIAVEQRPRKQRWLRRMVEARMDKKDVKQEP